MQRGAVGFIGKPFDEDPPEEQIKLILANSQPDHPQPNDRLRPFTGGDMTVHDSHIELAGVEIGGVRSATIIRRVITTLAGKPGAPSIRMSAKSLADTLGGGVTAQSVTSAINEFRSQCADKMAARGWECGKQDVIETAPGGGYRFKEWIKVREGLKEPGRSQTEVDAGLIMRKFAGKPSLTRRQINDGVDIPVLRVKAALARLVDSKRLKHVSGTGATTTYDRIMDPP